ncbi:YIP1 family protein [Candidatus Micrarchaeota archaeon]|nr:YIP1 family protein [Candidatus Micrarchaeota archaeon]
MDAGEIIKKIKNNLFFIPEAKFDELTKEKEYAKTFQYLVACLIVSLPINLVISILAYKEPAIIGGTPLATKIAMALITTIIGTVVAIPVLYILYAIMHGLLKLAGGKASLRETIQIYVYGNTCATIFGGIPIISLIIGLVSLSNIVLGVKRIHKMSLWKAIAVVVVIPIVLTVIITILVVTMMPFQNAA